MANLLSTSELLAQTAFHFTVGSTFLATANRKFEGMFNQGKSYDVGDYVNWHQTNRTIIQTGRDLGSTIDVKDRVLPLELLEENRFSDFKAYIDTDRQRKIGNFDDRVGVPAASAITALMNAKIADGAVGVLSKHTPVVSSNLSSFANIRGGIGLMRKMRAVNGTVYAALSNDDSASVQNSLSNQFNEAINSKILNDALLGTLAGMTIFEESSISYFINKDDLTSAIDVQIATTVPDNLDGVSTLDLKGLPANAWLSKGVIIDFEGYYWIDPLTRQKTTINFSVVVAEEVQATAGGLVTVTLAEPIAPATILAVNANVDSQILVDTYVKLIWRYNANVIYTESGIFAATPPLPDMPGIDCSVFRPKVGKKSKQNDELVVDSMRLCLASEIANSTTAWRLESQLAFAYNPDFCCLLLSNAKETSLT